MSKDVRSSIGYHNGPFFTIVTVALNCSDTIAKTIASIKAQSFCDYEWIVKDGGSSDSTLEMVKRSKLEPEIYCSNDSGIFDAMNQSLEVARGQYIVFLNSGDEFAGENVLKEIHSLAQDSNHPDIIYTDCLYLDQDVVYRYPTKLSKLFLYRRSLNHQCTYIKRDCYRKYSNFDLDFPELADNEYLARLVLGRGCSYKKCGIVGAKYLGNGASTKPSVRERRNVQIQKIRKRHFSTIELLALSTIHQLSLPGVRGLVLNSPFLKRLIGRHYNRMVSRFNSINI